MLGGRRERVVVVFARAESNGRGARAARGSVGQGRSREELGGERRRLGRRRTRGGRVDAAAARRAADRSRWRRAGSETNCRCRCRARTRTRMRMTMHERRSHDRMEGCWVGPVVVNSREIHRALTKEIEGPRSAPRQEGKADGGCGAIYDGTTLLQDSRRRCQL